MFEGIDSVLNRNLVSSLKHFLQIHNCDHRNFDSETSL